MNTGFGGIHGAILGLAARCLGDESWSQFVKPQTEGENLQASVLVPGDGSRSKFDVCIRREMLLLHNAIIEYLGAASDFTGVSHYSMPDCQGAQRPRFFL